jgi:hypothetical protein
MCKKTETRDGTLKTIVKDKSGKNETMSNVMSKSNTAVLITDLKLYYYQYRSVF